MNKQQLFKNSSLKRKGNKDNNKRDFSADFTADGRLAKPVREGRISDGRL